MHSLHLTSCISWHFNPELSARLAKQVATAQYHDGAPYTPLRLANVLIEVPKLAGIDR